MRKRQNKKVVEAPNSTLAAINNSDDSKDHLKFRKRFSAAVAVGLLLAFAVLGVTINMLIAPSSQAGSENVSGNKESSSWLNVFAQPAPSPSQTPQLDKQNIYAGGRLIAVETAGSTPNTGQQASDLVVWRQSSGAWYIRDSGDGTMQSNVFGQSGDVAVPADFDGDNLADFCVFRPNSPSSGLATWYIQPNGSASYFGFQFGLSSDIPAPADFDGDGKADVAVWRYSNKTFYALLSSSNTLYALTMQQISTGQAADVPVPADYDGDGMADAAIFRPGSTCYWYIQQSANNNAEIATAFGGTGDLPVSGDYDGDGKFDIAIRRDSTNQWIFQQSSNAQNAILAIPTATITLQSADRSVQGDYDGDGRTDAAVWRPSNGTWYIRKSTDGSMRADAWGQSGDVPVPAPMKR